MQRQRLMRALANAAFDSDGAVTYPDHPLLIRGPDILGHDRSGLVAWFVYTTGSPSPASRRESSRVVLSRLALPQGTQFVAVFVGDTPAGTPPVELFDEAQTRDAEGRLILEERVNAGAGQLAETLRPYQFERFAEAWSGSSTPMQYDERSHGRPTLDLRRKSLRRLPKWLADGEDRLIGSIDSRAARGPVLSMIGSLAATATSLDFGLDSGIAGLSETAAMLEGGDGHLALHTLRLELDQRERSRTTDPYKPYRAAAFAGAQVVYPEES